MCQDRHILLIAEPYLKALEESEIPSGYVPFVVETDQFLSLFHFKTLFEKSGETVLFYAPDVGEATCKALKTLNDETLQTYHQNAVVLVQSTEAYIAFTCKNVSKQEIKTTQRIQHG